MHETRPMKGRHARRGEAAAGGGDRATYVYCVVDRDRTGAVRGLPPGVPGGSPPRLLPLTGRLFAVVSDVPRARYAPEAIEAKLGDLDWVSTIALAHEAVVERMTRVRAATVIPLKLFTMFSEEARAAADLRARAPRLARIARRIRGCDEWGVRIMRGETLPPPRGAAPRTGTAFLVARKAARDGAREQSEAMRAAAADALAVLQRLAKQVATHHPPAGAASPPLLDAAFLVPRSRAPRFRAGVKRAAAACRRTGAQLTLSGPWPAYNFVDGGSAA